ncbi:hypothetical protein [Shewanella sp.]|uniref:hypothetical protein n=1 Tax=Shewanella sp. TaxID=50422 RepID=UPI003D0C3D2B
MDWCRWYPKDVYYRCESAVIDWRFLGDQRFTAPFFEQTLRQAPPATRNSSWQQLAQIAQRLNPVIEPTGFIFHSSRCGSTLLSQMLARLPENIVISEAPVIDMALRSSAYETGIDDTEKIMRLQNVIRVLGQQRFANETRLFIKLDAWSIAEFPIIARAYPQAAKLFLYREPAAILLSHQRQPGMHMIPGLLLGAPFDAAPANLSFEEYRVWVLAAIFKLAYRYFNHHQGLCVHYDDITQRTEQILAFFQLALTTSQLQQIQGAIKFDAKAPSLTYQPYQQQAQLNDELQQLLHRWLHQPYQALEQIRAHF